MRPYRRRETFYWFVINLSGRMYTWADSRIQRSRGL